MGAGVAIERSGNNPVPAIVPGVGDKPEEGLLQQPGQPDCSLYDRSGFHKDEGCTLAVGKGFRIGFHTVDAGWTIKPGKTGPVLTATVRNDNPGAIAGFWKTFHLSRYDGSLVEIVWCDSKAPFAAGESRIVTCQPLTPEGNAPFDSVAIS
jgi:hypothetical protein